MLTALIQPNGNPRVDQGQSIDITIPGALPGSLVGWIIRRNNTVYATSASPQGWSVSANNTLYQGVVITAPTGVNTKHNLELQCSFAGRVGVGHFDLIGVDGDPGSDVPPASPIEIGSAIACGCEARAVLGNRTGSPARALRRNAIADAQFIGRQTVNSVAQNCVYINSHAL